MYMRKYLLPKEGEFYKANLHCHSTYSDGKHTPAELKQIYKSNGYAILAITDHEILVDHSNLDDEDFITITGYEWAVIEKEDYSTSKTMEFNLLARQQHNTTHICFDPKYIVHGDKSIIPSLKYAGEYFEREYKVECFNKLIKTANENGFLVSYNHPSYSFETSEYYGRLEGLFAMEIYNSISFMGKLGIHEYNPHIYDIMLRLGRRISCIAADDSHSRYDRKNPHCEYFGGFNMIKAPSLTYQDVIAAMERGDMYASMGPTIMELYIENDTVHIKCSPSKSIIMNTKWRAGGHQRSRDGELISHAEFSLPDKRFEYMRFDIVDEYGQHANTRAYYFDELF